MAYNFSVIWSTLSNHFKPAVTECQFTMPKKFGNTDFKTIIEHMKKQYSKFYIFEIKTQKAKSKEVKTPEFF